MSEQLTEAQAWVLRQIEEWQAFSTDLTAREELRTLGLCDCVPILAVWCVTPAGREALKEYEDAQTD